jgi:muramoyltetrapeptide carboxypeptidase
MLNFPPLLQAGDKVITIAPSGKVNRENVTNAIDILQNQFGLQVIQGENLFKTHYKFAGTDEQRLKDLQWALDHQAVKAIFCARGGYGITRIVDALDFTTFKEYPKWVVGFSDITALHHKLYQEGFVSIHGPVLNTFNSIANSSINALDTLLKTGVFSFTAATHPENVEGTAEGPLVGGNLSMIVNQLGTSTEIDTAGKILFIEEVGEPLYHIDRMMVQLKRSGKLDGLKGLVVGEFTNTQESPEIFGESVAQIIRRHTKEMVYPIAFNMPFGHGKENMPIAHGVISRLQVNGEESILKILSKHKTST